MSSNFAGLSEVLELLVVNEPKSVCDLGAGFGKWGVLARLHLEHHPYKKDSWDIIINAVEIFPDYLNLTRDFYDYVFTGDIRKTEIKSYDVVLFLDVIEHLEKEEGLKFLSKLIQFNKFVIVVTPKGFKRQGAIRSNINEIHQSGWKTKDFQQLGLNTIVRKNKIIAFSKGMKYSRPIKRKLPLSVRKFYLKHFKPDKYFKIYGED